MIQLPPSLISDRVANIEASLTLFEPHQLAGELTQMVENPQDLSVEHRLGCMAEIDCWRFMPIRGEQRQPWDIYFGPIASGTTQDGLPFNLPDAKTIPREVIEHWSLRSEQSPHPLIRARHGDLAWEIGALWNREHPDEPKVARPMQLALRTIDAYIKSVVTGLSGTEHQAWMHLNRALEIALLVKDAERIEQAKQAAFAYARSSLVNPRSGYWWNLHSMFWEAKGVKLQDTELAELIGWIQDALEKYSDFGTPETFNPHWATDAAEMLRLWHRKLGKADLGVEAVKTAGIAFETMAERADPLTAIAWLEDLTVKYRRDNLLDDAVRIEAAIRSRSQAAEDSMIRREVSYEVPAEQMEGWLSSITAGSLSMSLGRIAAYFIRSEESLKEIVDQMAEQAPLQAHIPISIMGPHGFTTARIGAASDDIPGRVMHLASTLIGQEGPWLNLAFERAKEAWQLDAAKIFAWMVNGALFSPIGHGLLRQGLEAWQAGDYPKAIHLLVPQVESAIREWMFALGASPMLYDKEDGGFESMGLGRMLHAPAVREKIHPPLRHHLRCLYTHPKGINLRNRIAHGWAGDELVGRGMANWVVHSLIAIRVCAKSDCK